MMNSEEEFRDEDFTFLWADCKSRGWLPLNLVCLRVNFRKLKRKVSVLIQAINLKEIDISVASAVYRNPESDQ